MSGRLRGIALVGGWLLGLAACEEKVPAPVERAAEKVEKAADKLLDVGAGLIPDVGTIKPGSADAGP